ncbi:unnamed protein product [Brugia pahangi]|uniref:TLDc domain-containing protein n=1 Tax=Brugia pahangi TaxID=6280 RepID=A0A0N4TZ15_BRUPA|nr:unnamed protein product [Brugia pahangi]
MLSLLKMTDSQLGKSKSGMKTSINPTSKNKVITGLTRLDEPQNSRNMTRTCLNSHFITCCNKVGHEIARELQWYSVEKVSDKRHASVLCRNGRSFSELYSVVSFYSWDQQYRGVEGYKIQQGIFSLVGVTILSNTRKRFKTFGFKNDSSTWMYSTLSGSVLLRMRDLMGSLFVAAKWQSFGLKSLKC